MIIRHSGTRHAFTIVDRTAFEDDRLSAEAKGVYGYCIVKPDNWRISAVDIQKRCNIGRDKFRRIFAELEQFGYAEMINHRGEDGTIKGREWIIYEVPSLNTNRSPENPPFGDSTEALKTPTSVKTDSRLTRLSSKEEEDILNTKREEINTKARAPRFTSWFAEQWGIQGEISHRVSESIQALTDAQFETIGEHLPKYLKAKGSWAGTPERYLIDKKYTEAIYQTPPKSNGAQQVGPPTPRKRNYNV